MNTHLSWLIPLVSGIYLLGIRMVWMLLEQKNVQNFVSDCWKTIAEDRSDY